ncbi:MAG: FMN-binding protein [Eubacteriales bacterium]
MKKRNLVITIWCLLIIVAAFFLVKLWIDNRPKYLDYNDGIYVGEAQGMRKHLKVQITLEDGYITQVEVIEHYEKGSAYYSEPVQRIPEAILKEQSPEVDVVAGASFTSYGIMDAVIDALEQANK